MKKILGFLAASLISVSASAAVIPYGIHSDVQKSTVTNDWEWSMCYQGTYGSSVSINSAFSSCGGDYVMLASARRGSDTFDLLAAALFTDVTTYTAHNQTHSANGVEWYYNGGSMGFAPLGSTILQNSADINGSGQLGQPVDATGDLRLSWHTSGGYGSTPTALNGGWRSGLNTWLNSDHTWERFIFTANATPVSEPASIALLGLGLLGLGMARRRTQA